MKFLQDYIKNTALYRQAGNTRLYYISTACKGAIDCIGWKTGFWLYINMSHLENIFPKDHFNNLAKRYLQKQKDDPSFIDKIMDGIAEKEQLLDKFYNEIDKIEFLNLDLGDIQKIMLKLDRLNGDYWGVSFFCDVFDPLGDKLLADEIRDSGLKLDHDEISILLRSKELNYTQKERLGLLNILRRLDDISNDELDNLLQNHAKDFFYVDNSWESTRILTKDDFKRKIDELKDEDTEEQLHDLNSYFEKEHNKIKEKHNISDKLMDIFYFFRQLVVLRDKRKQHTLLSNHYYDMLAKRISEFFDVPFNELRVMEVNELCDKNISKQTIMKLFEQRKKLFVGYYHDGISEFIYGKDAVVISDMVHKSLDSGSDTIKGNIASKGKVKGIVKVIIGETHFSKFNGNEVLVAPMTRPEYLPIMKKALAIITDEGGITSHAAIVSRELGIPCIIGTQIATKVLKDGDMVEVDADKGIVRRKVDK